MLPEVCPVRMDPHVRKPQVGGFALWVFLGSRALRNVICYKKFGIQGITSHWLCPCFEATPWCLLQRKIQGKPKQPSATQLQSHSPKVRSAAKSAKSSRKCLAKFAWARKLAQRSLGRDLASWRMSFRWVLRPFVLLPFFFPEHLRKTRRAMAPTKPKRTRPSGCGSK